MSKRMHSMKSAMNISSLNYKTTEEIIKEFKSSINNEIDDFQNEKHFGMNSMALVTEMQGMKDKKGNSTQDILQRVLDNCNSKNKKRTFKQIQYTKNGNFEKKRTSKGIKKDEVVDAILNTDIIDELQDDKTPENHTCKKPLDVLNKSNIIAIGVLEKAKKEKPFKPPTIKPPSKNIWNKITDLFN